MLAWRDEDIDKVLTHAQAVLEDAAAALKVPCEVRMFCVRNMSR
jgi:hypothetical protein